MNSTLRTQTAAFGLAAFVTLAIDGVLIGMIMAFIAGVLPRFLQFHNGPGGWLIALALYGAVMWRHKGTTIGGIVYRSSGPAVTCWVDTPISVFGSLYERT